MKKALAAIIATTLVWENATVLPDTINATNSSIKVCAQKKQYRN